MKILVEGVSISCAHFIEIDGVFERLHGHNLIFSAEVEGEGGLVMDFRDLHSNLSEATAELDHHLLIPRDNEALSVRELGDNLEIIAAGKRYRIPESDAVLLPISNSTAEEIARYVHREVSSRLPTGVRLRYVAVEEMEGRKALYEGD